ncbi:hypothetical protein F5B17DRAFT_199736 [Nemania serpens]|nr:hypothetical protein F5B17DRAFT_199736 [Nemania serpens]
MIVSGTHGAENDHSNVPLGRETSGTYQGLAIEPRLDQARHQPGVLSRSRGDPRAEASIPQQYSSRDHSLRPPRINTNITSIGTVRDPAGVSPIRHDCGCRVTDANGRCGRGPECCKHKPKSCCGTSTLPVSPISPTVGFPPPSRRNLSTHRQHRKNPSRPR